MASSQPLLRDGTLAWSVVQNALDACDYQAVLQALEPKVPRSHGDSLPNVKTQQPASAPFNSSMTEGAATVTRCKVFCYLQLGRFQDARRLIEGQQRVSLFWFEYAYALYKLNCFVESLAIVFWARRERPWANSVTYHKGALKSLDAYNPLPVASGDVNDQNLALLEAQLLYRMGWYSASQSLYTQFLNQPSLDDVPAELFQVNAAACAANLAQRESSASAPQDETALDGVPEGVAYDLLFNKVCSEMKQGNLERAKECLRRAEVLLKNEVEEKRVAEWPSFLVQRHYLHCVEKIQQKSSTQAHGLKTDKAETTLEGDELAEHLEGVAEDATLDFVAGTNRAVWRIQLDPTRKEPSGDVEGLLVLAGSPPRWLVENALCNARRTSISMTKEAPCVVCNFHSLSKKHIKNASTLALRLTASQLVTVLRNACAVMLYKRQYRECLRYMESLPYLDPQLVSLFSLAQAASDPLKASRTLHRAAQLQYGCPEGLDLAFRAALLVLESRSDLRRAKHILSCITGQQLLTLPLSPQCFKALIGVLQRIQPRRFKRLCNKVLSIVQCEQTKCLDGSPILLEPCAAFGHLFYKSGRYRAAYTCFQKATGATRDTGSASGSICRRVTDMASYAGLLQSLARFDVVKANEELETLQKENARIFRNQALLLIDPDDVEQLSVALEKPSHAERAYFRCLKTSPPLRSAVDTVERVAGVSFGTVPGSRQRSALVDGAKRKRRQRLPKGFDPQNPGPLPDPERWIPKHERTTYKKTRRGNIKTFRGAQGAVQNAALLANELKKGGASSANVDIKKDSTLGGAKRRVGGRKHRK